VLPCAAPALGPRPPAGEGRKHGNGYAEPSAPLDRWIL
jgi:hypothetical protein